MGKLPPFPTSTRRRDTEGRRRAPTEGRQPETRAKYRGAISQLVAGDVAALAVMADSQVAKCADLDLAKEAINALVVVDHMADLDVNGHQWLMAAIDQATTYWLKGLNQSLSGRTSGERARQKGA